MKSIELIGSYKRLTFKKGAAMASYQDLSGRYLNIFGEFTPSPKKNLWAPAKNLPDCDDDDECNGFCPECGQIIRCDAYEELKDEWDSFFT